MKNSDRIYLSLYYILKFFVTFMPDCILHFLALIVARIAFHLNKKHRKIINTNLQICFPQYTQKERDIQMPQRFMIMKKTRLNL